MKLSRNSSDMLSQMELLGIASILNEDDDIDESIVISWVNPRVMSVSTIHGELEEDTVAASIWKFKEQMVAVRDVLSKKILIGGRNHSPLSPRISKSFTDKEWANYFLSRCEAIDSTASSIPLVTNLAGSLGYPCYWGHDRKGNPDFSNLDLGASVWEMSARNSGSEFMINKYIKLLDTIAPLTTDEIADRISGRAVDSAGETRNACGFRRPGSADVLLSWVAYQAISCFPTRPVVHGMFSCGSLSTGVIREKSGRRSSMLFVLPINQRPITVERYLAICRCSSIYRLGRWLVQNSDQRSLLESTLPIEMRGDASWLLSHQVDCIATYERYVGGSASCPEYWSLPGNIHALPSTEHTHGRV